MNMNVQVDLTNCDREPIHLLGNVQPFGFFLGVSPEWIVVHASENVEKFLKRTAQEILGKSLTELLTADAIHAIRGRLQLLSGPDAVERLFRRPLTTDGREYDIAVHRSSHAILIEAEPSAPPEDVDPISLVRTMLMRVQAAPSFDKFCFEAARQLRALIGYDRVMIYRFDQDEAGEVIAESVKPGLVKFLGLHYPASDIPRQARILYARNLLRIIPDIHSIPSRIVSDASQGTGPVDLSMAMLRSVSPIHIEYLNNMGVGASLSVSILHRGRLWGLLACHNMTPLHVSYERRSAAELFGQMFALLLEGRERAEEAELDSRAQDAQTKLVNLLAGQSFTVSGLAQQLAAFSQIIPFDGVAVAINEQIFLEGSTPTYEETLSLVHSLMEKGDTRVFATHALSRWHEPAQGYQQRACGMLAIPVSRRPRDYVLFFRKEFARAVQWAGDPTKPAQLGPNGVRLTPRKSFEAWSETVRGQSKPWAAMEIRLAEGLRVTLLEVILRLAEAAAQERKSSNERQELLIAELNHRVRNILSLIRGLISQGRERATTLEEFAAVIGGRVQALARAHDQITIDNWGPASLRTLFTAETAAYLSSKANRVVLDGPDVLLDPRAFSTLALVTHELLTNSAKYGALADSVGRVNVRWGIGENGQLRIHWQEEGGPPVRAPSRRGFGSTVIERSIPFDLNGEASLQYALAGVKAEFTIPGNFVKVPREPLPVRPHPSASARSVRLSGRALVVEDNMIIALDAESTLEDMGAEGVEVVPSVAEALRVIDRAPPKFAILDVNLGTESSFPIADRLIAIGVPIVFATGYGKNIEFPERFAEVPVVSKPYNEDSLAPKIAEALERRQQEQA